MKESLNTYYVRCYSKAKTLQKTINYIFQSNITVFAPDNSYDGYIIRFNMNLTCDRAQKILLLLLDSGIHMRREKEGLSFKESDMELLLCYMRMKGYPIRLVEFKPGC